MHIAVKEDMLLLKIDSDSSDPATFQGRGL